MGVSISGAVSGLDSASIIKQLMNAENQSRTKYADKLNLFEWRQSALQGIKTDLLGLKTAATSLQDIFSFPPMSGTSSDDSKVGVSTTSSSAAGTYAFSDVVLGKVETWRSSGQMSTQAISGYGNQTGTTNTLDETGDWNTAGFANTPDGSITITESGIIRTFNLSDYANPKALTDAISSTFTLDLVWVGAPGAQQIAIQNANAVEYSLVETGTNGFFSEAGLKFFDYNATLATLNNYIDNDFVDGSFTINGKTITIATGTDTLNSLISKINSAGADVTAFFNYERLSLSRITAGNLPIQITNDTANFLGATKLALTSAGSDLTFVMNGVNMTRTSNTFDINSTTFNLLQNTGAGETVSVTVTQNVDTMVDEVQAWIDKYNSITATAHNYLTEEKVQGATTDADRKKGLLRNDSTLRMIYSDLYSLTSVSVDGLATTMDSLQEIGVSRDSSGQLTISDEATLRNALTNDATVVSSIFNGSADALTPGDERGIAVRLEELLTELTTTTSGIMDLKIKNENDGADRVQMFLDSFDARMEKVEQRYNEQFAAMESALSAMQQQSTEIAGLLASINSSWA